MNRDDYIQFLDQALFSPHGIRLNYGDDRTARRVRGKIYRIREELRAEARTEPCTEPVVAYAADGQLKGVIDILRHRKPPPTAYDGLRLRVSDGALLIVPIQEHTRRVDELEPTEVRDLWDGEVNNLCPWPPWGR
jgi:hypothetical protein